MQYNRIVQQIVNGEYDDMEQDEYNDMEHFGNDREMLYNRITLLNNLYNNMSSDDKIVYKSIVMGHINDIKIEL